MKSAIISVGVIMMLLAGVIGYQASQLNQSQSKVGSVQRGGEYIATGTAALTAGAQTLIRSAYQTSSSILGSITVASTSPATTNPIKIWNATSTTDVASSSLFRMPSNIAAGTYTFDLSLPRGLIVEIPSGYSGDWVITYR